VALCHHRAMSRGPHAVFAAALSTVALVLGATAGPAAAATQPDVITPISATILAPPAPVPTSDGRRHLVYELQVLNWTTAPVTLDRVEVRDGRTERRVAAYAGARLDPLLVQAPFAPPAPRTLAPETSTILWFDVVLPRGGAAPRSLVHRVTVNGVTAPVGRTPVGPKPIVISPPLRGPLMVDANGCCGDTPHVRAIQTIDGVRWLSQRYAIDYIQTDAQGRSYVGDLHDPANYLIWDEPAYSVASGVVTSVLDGRPTLNPPDPDPALNSYNAARFATGNHVIVRIRKGVYAMYAHLRKGKIRVKVGQKVRRGQVLGLSGNSGNSTAPHLHFQLMDRNSPLGANGVPYVYDRYVDAGRITTPYELYADTALGTLAPANRVRTGVLPMTRDVLTFR